MKLFHTATLGFLLLFISTGTNAQKFYLDLKGGYGFPLASQSIAVTDGSSKTQDNLVKGTFGKGMNLGLGFGMMVTNQMGLEIGTSYFNSATIKSHDDYNSGGSHFMEEYEFSSSIIRITPALRLTTTNEHVNAYARIGCVIGVNGYYEEKIKAAAYFSNPQGFNQSVELTQEYKGRVSTGFSGSLGLSYNATQTFSIFIEGNGIAHSWAPKQGEITEFKEDGYDQLNSLSVSEREVEFVNEVTETSNPPLDEPTKSLKMYVPLSAIFINVGIQLRFGGTSKNKDAAAPQKN